MHSVHYTKLTPIIAALFVTVLAGWSAYVLEQETHARNDAYFETLIFDTQDAILDRFASYEGSLRGGLGLYFASEEVTREEWKNFVKALNVSEALPGISGVGYIDNIRADNLDEYLEITRSDDVPDFVNHPVTEFDDKFIIKYIEPMSNNLQAVGLDIGFEANRREAAENARDKGEPSLTKKILLVQDQKRQAGFLLLIPFYETKNTPNTVRERRERLQGWIYAPFIGPNFFKGIENVNKEQLHFKVYDGYVPDSENLIYDSDVADDHTHQHNSRETQVNVAGRTWTISWHANSNFVPPASSNIAYILFVFGMLFAGFLYFVTRRLLKTTDYISKKVSEQTKELKDLHDFQKLVSDSNPALVFVKDQDFRIVDANESFLSVYPGKKREDIIGHTTVEDFDPDEAEAFLADDREAFRTGFVEKEETLLMPNGEVKTLLTKKVRFENTDGKPYILGIASDITDRKNAEVERERLIRELEISNHELDNFAYIASHDLKAPLRVIDNTSKWIEEDLEQHLNDDTRESMVLLRNRVARMEKLLDDLLEYSRIGKSFDAKYQEQLSAYELIENIKDLLPAIDRFDVKVDDDLQNVIIHKMPLQQILLNLISNAVKHHDKNYGIIEIDVKDDGDNYIFVVKDDGPGIEEQFHEKIFKMFQSLQPRDKVEGSGMGLAMVKKNVELFGGKITVKSELGKGSEFHVVWPKRQETHKGIG